MLQRLMRNTQRPPWCTIYACERCFHGSRSLVQDRRIAALGELWRQRGMTEAASSSGKACPVQNLCHKTRAQHRKQYQKASAKRPAARSTQKRTAGGACGTIAYPATTHTLHHRQH